MHFKFPDDFPDIFTWFILNEKIKKKAIEKGYTYNPYLWQSIIKILEPLAIKPFMISTVSAFCFNKPKICCHLMINSVIWLYVFGYFEDYINRNIMLKCYGNLSVIYFTYVDDWNQLIDTTHCNGFYIVVNSNFSNLIYFVNQYH